MKEFPCKKSLMIVFLTISLSILLLFLGIQSVSFFASKSFFSWSGFNYLGFTLSCAIIILFYFFLAPRKMVIDEPLLLIIFLFRKIEIPISEINTIVRVHKIPVVDFGSRGYFGYIGLSMSGVILWVQDPKNMILIKTDKKSYVISCEDSDGLIARIKASA